MFLGHIGIWWGQGGMVRNGNSSTYLCPVIEVPSRPKKLPPNSLQTKEDPCPNSLLNACFNVPHSGKTRGFVFLGLTENQGASQGI